MDNTTRKLVKLLQFTPDQIYHLFCLALCLTWADGTVSQQEGETLTRLGFGLGLSPEDIQALTKNAESAIRETSVADVIAFSLASLKKSLSPEQMAGAKEILRFVAKSDRKVPPNEKALLDLIEEIWKD